MFRNIKTIVFLDVYLGESFFQCFPTFKTLSDKDHFKIFFNSIF